MAKMKLEDVKAELDKLGVKYDAKADYKTLTGLLADNIDAEEVEAPENADEIEKEVSEDETEEVEGGAPETEEYQVLKGLEFPRGEVHNKGDILELTEEEADGFKNGLIVKVSEIEDEEEVEAPKNLKEDLAKRVEKREKEVKANAKASEKRAKGLKKDIEDTDKAVKAGKSVSAVVESTFYDENDRIYRYGKTYDVTKEFFAKYEENFKNDDKDKVKLSDEPM